MKNIYIDCEWFLRGKIFLIGFGNTTSNIHQVFGKNLNQKNIYNIILKANNKYVFIYGPDIAYIEKNFHFNIRNNIKCINLLKIAKCYLTLKKYSLAEVEKYFNICRTTNEYKENIFRLSRDWYNLERRKRCLLYNYEDVLNLILVKQAIFKKFNIKSKDLENFTIK